MAGADDYYEALGVSRTATADEIKRAYLSLARELHPDANPGNRSSEERFKVVTAAYETLRDPERRRQYDMFGAGGQRGSGDPFGGFGAGSAGFGDIFDAFFGGNGGAAGGRGRGGPNRGEDAEAAITIEFAEAVFGVDRELTVRLPITCTTCSGTGARDGTSPTTCKTCGGVGEVRRVRQTLLGQMVTATPCPTCNGTGQEIASPCLDCRGEGRRREERSFVVEVPAGVDDGSTLRLPGRGAAGPRGGPAGDLYVHLHTRAHPTFNRDGSDLFADVHIAMTQAALGLHLPFETLDGTEELVVPGATQTGKQIRLRGRGVPHVQGRGRGDLVVTLVVDTPAELTKAQEELLRHLAAERDETVAGPEAGLLSKLRGAFK